MNLNLSNMPNNIYQFDLTGKCINKFDSVKKCYTHLGLIRHRISYICRRQTLVNKEYYLSYYPEIMFVQPKPYSERLAKLDDSQTEFTIGDLERMKQYEDNLMIYFTIHFDKLNEVQRKSILKEFAVLINLTTFI